MFGASTPHGDFSISPSTEPSIKDLVLKLIAENKRMQEYWTLQSKILQQKFSTIHTTEAHHNNTAINQKEVEADDADPEEDIHYRTIHQSKNSKQIFSTENPDTEIHRSRNLDQALEEATSAGKCNRGGGLAATMLMPATEASTEPEPGLRTSDPGTIDPEVPRSGSDCRSVINDGEQSSERAVNLESGSCAEVDAFATDGEASAVATEGEGKATKSNDDTDAYSSVEVNTQYSLGSAIARLERGFSIAFLPWCRQRLSWRRCYHGIAVEILKKKMKQNQRRDLPAARRMAFHGSLPAVTGS